MYLALVPVIFLAGAFLKLSFSLIALSLIFISILYRFLKRDEYKWRQLVLQSTIDAITFLVFYLLLYLLYTSKGWTAAHVAIGRTVIETTSVLCYSVASILSNLASIFTSASNYGVPLNDLWSYASLPLLHSVPVTWLIFLAALAAITLLIFRAVWARVIHTEYRVMLLGLAVVHAVVLTSLFLGTAVGLEDRHFWPVSAVLLPGLVAIVLNCRPRLWRSLFMVIICVQLGYAAIANRYFLGAVFSAGELRPLALSFQDVSQRFVNVIERLDTSASGGRSVFFITNEIPLGLLVRNNPRLVSYWQPFDKTYVNAAELDRLIIIVRQQVASETTVARIESSFPTTKSWQALSLDNHMILCAGCGESGSLASLASVATASDTSRFNQRVLSVLESLDSRLRTASTLFGTLRASYGQAFDATLRLYRTHRDKLLAQMTHQAP